MSFSDNLSFILEIPFLKYLLAVAFVNENQYIGITFIMSLLAFKKFCIDSNLPVDDEAEEKSVLTEPISVLEDTQEVSGTTKEQAQAESAWKETFYSIYYEKFSKMKNTTLITKDKYDKIVDVKKGIIGDYL